MEKKIEGYWKSSYEPDYPMPVPNVLTQQEAEEIYAKFQQLINKCKNKEKGYNMVHYKGRSHSRIEKFSFRK
jgi:hypothetical protein